MDEADRMVSLGFEEVINFILDALPVTNLKPDTEEAEDGAKMSMVLQAAEGDDSSSTSLALYRQTVGSWPARSLGSNYSTLMIRIRSCSQRRCRLQLNVWRKNTFVDLLS